MGATGHVFVVHGDLINIHADEILVPCDGDLNVTSRWKPLLGECGPGSQADWVKPTGVEAPPRFREVDRPPMLLEGREPALNRLVWLINSGDANGNADWLLGGIKTAIQAIAKESRDSQSGRARRLIALPLLGVGAGGFGTRRGEVIKRMVVDLQEAVSSKGAPDVVLVLYRRSDYAAVQHCRSGQSGHEGVRALAQRIKHDGLVLFIGAGASVGAGLPVWKDLLGELAAEANLGDMVEATLSLPPPDAADVIERGLGEEKGIQELIKERFDEVRDGYSLIHALLASLRIREAVTTNYDILYENAAIVPHGGTLKVLPRERRTADEPWLLKLHGDLKQEKSIVLTRGQYVRFDADSAPLASVVQSHMVTKHMLFVGYSLSDENFIRLARQVRHLFQRPDKGKSNEDKAAPVGTVLSLFENRARRKLWEDDLDFLPMYANSRSDELKAEDPRELDAEATRELEEKLEARAARELEIFLDGLARESADDSSFVMDDAYSGLLSDSDRTLVGELRAVASQPRDSDTTSAVWPHVSALLEELGMKLNPRSEL